MLLLAYNSLLHLISISSRQYCGFAECDPDKFWTLKAYDAQTPLKQL